jgi:carbon starvation protein
MAQIFSKVTHGKWLDLWYHFAIMFEALFILTTLDAGTRVGRYILQDALGHVWKPLGNTKNLGANVLASALMVAGWGYFLIQGVRDPLGGINSLWPLFGIANQMLAAIGLCLATTIILKMNLRREAQGGGREVKRQRPALAFITLVPLVWLLAVTFTAGVEKIFHSDPRIGFLAQAKSLEEKLPTLDAAVASAKTFAEATVIATAQKAVAANHAQHFNNLLDAGIAGMFLTLVSIIVLISVREWIFLLARKKPAELHESDAVWLPDYAVKEPGANVRTATGAAVLALGLAKELSGEAQLERAQQQACECNVHAEKSAQQIYVEATQKRFTGVNRCC